MIYDDGAFYGLCFVDTFFRVLPFASHLSFIRPDDTAWYSEESHLERGYNRFGIIVKIVLHC